MTKNPVIYLDHINICIRKIGGYTVDLTEENFLKNSLIQVAVIRNFEIIGEAAKNLDINYEPNTRKLNGRRLRD